MQGARLKAGWRGLQLFILVGRFSGIPCSLRLEVSDRARLVTKAEVFQLLLRDGNVVGLALNACKSRACTCA